jgi:hypothetical protein
MTRDGHTVGFGLTPRHRRLVISACAVALLLLGAALVANRAMQSSARTADGCTANYPFQSIPCDLYQQGRNRVQLASAAEEASAPVSAAQAAAAITKLSPESRILETRLIKSWSSESTDPATDGQLLWAVSEVPPGGAFISGGGFLLNEMAKLRANGDARPLTLDEDAALSAAVDRDMQQARASITESYHVDFIDPVTGAYVGAVEGSR